MEQDKLTYHKELDGVRGVAALMVMCFHLNMGNAATTKILELGQTGVTLFFVLSGFLITRILLATKETPNYFSSFYAKRALRIFPLYYLGLAVYLYIPHMRHGNMPPVQTQAFYLTYLQNFGFAFKCLSGGPKHFWSLAVEEQFYLFWPILIYLVSRKNLVRICWGFILGAIILRLALEGKRSMVEFFTFTNTDALAAGGILAIWEANGKIIRLKRFIPYLTAISATGILLLTILYHPYHSLTALYLRPLLLIIFFFTLIWYVIVADNTSRIKKVFANRALTYLGLISYGLYVYHPMCYYLITRHMHIDNAAVMILVRLSSAIVVASVSYFLFERWFIRLKRYF